MADQDTRYSFRSRGPYQLERAKTNIIKLESRLDNAAAAPASGTVSVYRPDGSALVDAQSVTISSSIAQYTISAGAVPATENYGKGWSVEWSLVMPDGVTHDWRGSAALVRRRLLQVISAQDLYELHPDLSPTATGSVAASGETWQGQLDAAFADTLDRLIEEGHDPNLIISGYSLRRVLLYETLTLIARHLGSSLPEGNAWQRLEDTYTTLARNAWADASFVKAIEDEDTNPADPDTRAPAIGAVWFGARF